MSDNEANDEEQEKEQLRRIKKLRDGLASTDEKEILKAIEEAKEEGDARIVPDLIEVWAVTENEAIKKRILQIFYDLKDSDATEHLLEALDHPDIQDRSDLLAVFWNSRLDASEKIDKFTEIAVEGSYQEAFEALTAIEEMEGPFEENTVMEAQLWIKTYYAQGEDEKKPLIQGIDQTLRKIQEAI
ncbi:MAG: hypothetical protein ABEH38_10400 [Flavobacteriales bacterium]